jgi:hypothetical protein
MNTLNNIKSASKAFGTVPASFATLIDLGTEYSYNTIMVVSSLDTDVVLKIGSNEVTFPANKNITIENQIINGIIQYKYASAPSSGTLDVFFC